MTRLLQRQKIRLLHVALLLRRFSEPLIKPAHSPSKSTSSTCNLQLIHIARASYQRCKYPRQYIFKSEAASLGISQLTTARNESTSADNTSTFHRSARPRAQDEIPQQYPSQTDCPWVLCQGIEDQESCTIPAPIMTILPCQHTQRPNPLQVLCRPRGCERRPLSVVMRKQLFIKRT